MIIAAKRFIKFYLIDIFIVSHKYFCLTLQIWLKDAVQCQNCTLVCHKKCITKCQNATICGPFDAIIISPELKVSEAEALELNDSDIGELVSGLNTI